MKHLHVGRLQLGIVAGTRPVIYLHDIGGVASERTTRRELAHERGAWILVQAGHEGSDWRRGGVYDITGFAIDLLNVVASLGLDHVVLAASGASCYVAACAAQVAPDLIGGIDVLPGEGGWVVDPTTRVAVRDWVTAVNRLSRAGAGRRQRDDPVLSLGPPEPVTVAAVETWTSELSVTWWAGGDTPAGFPPGLRAAHSHWDAAPWLDTRLDSQPTVRYSAAAYREEGWFDDTSC